MSTVNLLTFHVGGMPNASVNPFVEHLHDLHLDKCQKIAVCCDDCKFDMNLCISLQLG